ncbi:cysteine peptidase family C39 domain-containing protein [Gillisia sp. Hel_I_86]|uniref:cysteine peptidase family C39 domain-containing protein n=1 Tax=Gillisia sp. Hel_I_86 TaxID=1249981 RepID=UPI0021BDB4A1|nr:cysteine peptidase family C39 domain-containing protein [Gillisia sp. Hel_I_86]
MSKIKIKQHDITDCGAACLASISAHYKLQLPIARIRQYASTDKKGTNVLGLLEAAKKLGFEAKGVRGDFESLYKIPKPAIAHIIVLEKLQHYVVIYEVTKQHIKVMDPGDGKMHKKSHEEFKKEWTGVLVLLLPEEEFTTGNEKVSVYKRFWFLLKPHKFVLVQAFVGSIIYTLLGFSTSIYIQKITDYVLIGGNTNLLNLLSIIMLILLVLQILISIFKDIFLYIRLMSTRCNACYY